MRIDTAVTTLLTQLGQATQDLSRVATRVSTLLQSENVAAVGASLRNLEEVTRVLAARTGDLGDGIRDGRVILANWAQASRDVPALMSRLKDGAASMQEAIANISRTTTGVDRAVSETRRDLVRASGDTVTQVQALLAELQQLTRTMQRLGGELERDPNMLLFGRRARERGPGE
jgi:phospholipid/cholesterol/gamma-HCH transport system substrate-binding protein